MPPASLPPTTIQPAPQANALEASARAIVLSATPVALLTLRPEDTLTEHLCRCCLGPVAGFLLYGKRYVHCITKTCALHLVTREESDWLTMDLDQWKGAQQHPEWNAAVEQGEAK